MGELGSRLFGHRVKVMGSRHVGRFTGTTVVVIVVVSVLSGCVGQYNFGPVGDPVGLWISTRGNSSLELNEDGTGLFALCEPDYTYYHYTAEDWPSSTPITWQAADGRIDLLQDPESPQVAGAGFDTLNKILVWAYGNLEMNADVNIVTFSTTDDETFECPPE